MCASSLVSKDPPRTELVSLGPIKITQSRHTNLCESQKTLVVAASAHPVSLWFIAIPFANLLITISLWEVLSSSKSERLVCSPYINCLEYSLGIYWIGLVAKNAFYHDQYQLNFMLPIFSKKNSKTLHTTLYSMKGDSHKDLHGWCKIVKVILAFNSLDMTNSWFLINSTKHNFSAIKRTFFQLLNQKG